MAAITAAVIGAGTAIYAAKKSSDGQKAALNAAKDTQKAADPYAQYRAGSASQLNTLSQNGYTPNFSGINQGLDGVQSATNKAANGSNSQLNQPIQFANPNSAANTVGRGDLYDPINFGHETVSAGGAVGSLQSYSEPYMNAILAAREQSAQRASAAQGYTGSGNALVAAAHAGTEATMYGYQLGEQDRGAAERTRQLGFDASYANANLSMQGNQLYAQQRMGMNSNMLDLGSQGIQRDNLTLQNNQLYANQLMNMNSNILQQDQANIQRDTLGMQGSMNYLEAMYRNEGMNSDAYNNRFNQLAMLSGADKGLMAAAGVGGDVSSGYQNVGQGNANMWTSIGSGVAGVFGAYKSKQDAKGVK